MDYSQMFSSLVGRVEFLRTHWASSWGLFQMDAFYMARSVSGSVEHFAAFVAREVAGVVDFRVPFEQFVSYEYSTAYLAVEVVEMLAHMDDQHSQFQERLLAELTFVSFAF